MKRITIMALAIAAMALGGVCVQASDAVEPASCTFTNNRGDTISYVSDVAFYRGTSVLFTNCMLQTTGTATQGLTDVTIQLKWGTETTNQIFAGMVQSAASGTWWCALTILTNWEAPNIQIKVTDVYTNSYIYPWKLIHTKASM